MDEFFIFNDSCFKTGTPVIATDNRSFRYGDGVFETIKIIHGKIINKQFHFERFFHGLAALKFEIPKLFTASFIEKKILELIVKNDHGQCARVRLTAFRAAGSIFDVTDNTPNYIIESWKLAADSFNKNGLIVEVFPDAKKECTIFSNLKSNNYLLPVMAGLYAKESKLDECIILNTRGNVCESIIGNIFMVKENEIFTPPLADGCVAGVMRRWMLEKFSLKKYSVIEKSFMADDLLKADEIFLTNAIYYLRRIKTFRGKNYGNTTAKEIYEQIITTLLPL